ncbi:MAG: Tim44 domain-containing protein, partial [Desulfovibrionaceae bacterium]
MNFKALLTIFIFVTGLLFVAVADADAARFGGGKSFGSKPSMQQKAPAPMMQQKAPAAGAAGAAGAAAAKPGFSMGGMMGGLLAGTLLGSLLFGGGGMGGGMGGGFMDILLIGILLFVGFKLYARFKASRSGQTATAGGPSMGRMQAPEEPMARQDTGMSWGNLQGQ